MSAVSFVRRAGSVMRFPAMAVTREADSNMVPPTREPANRDGPIMMEYAESTAWPRSTLAWSTQSGIVWACSRNCE